MSSLLPGRSASGPAPRLLLRLHNWRSALFSAIAGYRRRPFVWGEADCALFAADCVQAMTGVDLAEGYRGRYSSEAEARALLAREGAADLADFAAARLPEIAPALMRMGDLVAVNAPFGKALGICNLSALMMLRLDGIGTLPVSAAVRAFRI